ncbi:hypothetical protein B0T22DRAFT_440284 [Podospora appendiculata]|uniref:Uncharacterized protein n=1 Tax=Podospora appendiculata TaxID=314037 RepID=A0AAE1CCQ2_9PEZI|nr:hypothetical protein B0T22DRAFT_440284 [Podospora appendiculata]
MAKLAAVHFSQNPNGHSHFKAILDQYVEREKRWLDLIDRCDTYYVDRLREIRVEEEEEQRKEFVPRTRNLYAREILDFEACAWEEVHVVLNPLAADVRDEWSRHCAQLGLAFQRMMVLEWDLLVDLLDMRYEWLKTEASSWRTHVEIRERERKSRENTRRHEDAALETWKRQSALVFCFVVFLYRTYIIASMLRAARNLPRGKSGGYAKEARRSRDGASFICHLSRGKIHGRFCFAIQRHLPGKSRKALCIQTLTMSAPPHDNNVGNKPPKAVIFQKIPLGSLPSVRRRSESLLTEAFKPESPPRRPVYPRRFESIIKLPDLPPLTSPLCVPMEQDNKPAAAADAKDEETWTVVDYNHTLGDVEPWNIIKDLKAREAHQKPEDRSLLDDYEDWNFVFSAKYLDLEADKGTAPKNGDDEWDLVEPDKEEKTKEARESGKGKGI